MPSEVSKSAGSEAAQRLSFVWWGVLAGLLGTEALLLTYCFDTPSVAHETAWVAWTFFAAPKVFQIGLLGTLASILLGSRELWAVISRDALFGLDEKRSPRAFSRWGVFLPLHFVALALFAGFSVVLFEGDLERRLSYPGIWVGAWVLAGLTTAVFWGLACLSLPTWLGLVSNCWRQLLLGFVIGAIGWSVGRVATLNWELLSQSTFYLVDALLRLFFDNPVCDPTRLEIGTREFQVRIGVTCSGIQGLGLMAVFLTVYLWLFRRRLRFPAALLLVPLGMMGMLLLNSVRIALLIAIGHWGWPEVAVGGFHSQAGVLTFVALALAITAVAEWCPWLNATPAARTSREPDVAIAYVSPFLALLAASMVGAAFSSGFDWLYPLRIVIVAAVVWCCRKSYRELSGRCSWTAPALGAATFVIWVFLARSDSVSDDGWPVALSAAPAGWASAWLAFRVTGHVITVPLAEELAFRGFLIRQLTRRDFLAVAPDRFSWPAFVASSALFGALHGQSWLAGTLAGMLFALAQRHRGQIIDAVVAHATANGLLAGYVLVTGHWSLWS